ncbi:MAG: hypothetical protein GX605_11545, partial [Chloroflexi bacterium]|nr:hypothetical protein [Chloroflexota bacterium]
AALFMALDPFLIGHARVLHTDGPETAFLTLSLLALLVALRPDEGQSPPPMGWLFLSGLLAGWAVLAKAPAAIMAPFAILLMAWQLSRDRGLSRKSLWRLAQAGLVWGAAAAAGFFVGWPAMWVDPIGTLQKMLGLAGRFARTPHIDNFFLGQHLRDPGPLFYPLSLAMRTTPVVWLGLLGALPLLRRRQPRTLPLGALILFVCFYGAAMSVGAKKFERYLLPVYPVLAMVAAAGWAQIGVWAARVRPRGGARATTAVAAVVALAAAAQAVSALPYQPHYLVYANPLLGGPPQAAQWLPIGWGEGLEEASSYLQSLSDAQVTALWAVPAFSPVYPGQVLRLTEANLALADHVIVYIGDVQFGSPLIDQFHPRQEPAYTVNLHDVDYAWVYRQEAPAAHVAFLQEHAAEGSLLLADAPLLAARQEDIAAQTLVLEPGADESAVAAQLNEATRGRVGLWYLAAAAAPEDLRQAVQKQLALHAVPAQPPLYLPPGVTAQHFLLPAGAQFGATLVDQPAVAALGGMLRLSGYGMSSSLVEYPQSLEVVQVWEPESSPTDDYTAFVHLLDRQGRRWAQSDVRLTNQAGLGASLWQPQDTARIGHRLDLPAGIPPGRYALVTGLYDPAGRRLTDAAHGDLLTLQEIQVQSPRVPPSPEALDSPIVLNRVAWEGLTLLGASLPTTPLRPGDVAAIALDWQAGHPLGQDLSIALTLEREDGRPAARWEQPLSSFPTGQWAAGEVVRSHYDLPVPVELASGTYALQVVVHGPQGAAEAGEPLTIGWLPIEAREHLFAPPEPMTPVSGATFGNAIQMNGFWLDDA